MPWREVLSFANKRQITCQISPSKHNFQVIVCFLRIIPLKLVQGFGVKLEELLLTVIILKILLVDTERGRVWHNCFGWLKNSAYCKLWMSLWSAKTAVINCKVCVVHAHFPKNFWVVSAQKLFLRGEKKKPLKSRPFLLLNKNDFAKLERNMWLCLIVLLP